MMFGQGKILHTILSFSGLTVLYAKNYRQAKKRRVPLKSFER